MPAPEAQRQLRTMLAALQHESFYQTGLWSNETAGIYVGWVERAGSARSLPLCDEQSGFVLLLSGEEFSSLGLPPSAAERTAFPANLNGRFHGVLAGTRDGSVTLFNDRYGMHRLYYHEAADAFYFSAEAKAILAVRPELRRIEHRSLGEFIATGCVLENRSLFEGIGVLPPASAWVFKNSTLENKKTYFAPQDWEQQEPLEPEAYYHELRDVFAGNLPRYFKGTEHIGMSLTGGLDTRMIMAWQKPAPGSLPCYSFGGTYRECQDVVVARKVAQSCKQPYSVIAIGPDFLNRFPHYAERAVYLSDGCTAVNRGADLYANELARQIAGVRMTGNYGGEVLRRVVAFKPTMPHADIFRPELLSAIQTAAQTYSGVIQTHPLSFAVFRQAPWHHYGLLALEQTQVSLRTPYLDNDFVRTVFRAPASTLTNNDISLRLIADGSQTLRRIRTDRGYAGNGNRLRAFGMQQFLQFAAKAEYAYDYGMPQWVSRTDHFFAPLHLERLFLGRHKFAHYRVWYRDHLAHYVREILLDSRTLRRPYLNASTVETVVSGHLTGGRNYTSEIHQLLTLELVHRLFID